MALTALARGWSTLRSRDRVGPARSRTSRVTWEIQPETLRKYVRQVEAERGVAAGSADGGRAGGDQAAAARDYELRRANEILKAASVFFATELDADRPK